MQPWPFDRVFVRLGQEHTLSLEFVDVSLHEDQSVSQNASQYFHKVHGLFIVVRILGKNSFQCILARRYDGRLVEKGAKIQQTIVGNGVNYLAQLLARRSMKGLHAVTDDEITAFWSWKFSQRIYEKWPNEHIVTDCEEGIEEEESES